MRIIKTAIKSRGAKIAAALIVSGAAPILSVFAAEVLPKAYEYAAEAAKYSAVTVKPFSSGINNGDLMLYTPAPEVINPLITTEPIPEKQEAESAALLIRNISEETEDLSVFSANSGKILEVTYKGNLGADFINLPLGGQVRNCTDLSNGLVTEESRKTSDIEIEFYSEQPQILIMHTHTTESYESVEKNYYDSEYSSRSYDPENGVVAVGKAIAEELSAAGIAVIHDGTIHDEQYTGAYTRSLETVEEILSEFPSIKIVLDVHRDAIEDGESRVSAVTEINGKKAAQVMIISGAEEGEIEDYPDWAQNLTFAIALQEKVEENYKGLMRPLFFCQRKYNMHVTPCSLLLEMGTDANTLDEAVYSGRLIGDSLAELLEENM